LVQPSSNISHILPQFPKVVQVYLGEGSLSALGISAVASGGVNINHHCLPKTDKVPIFCDICITFDVFKQLELFLRQDPEMRRISYSVYKFTDSCMTIVFGSRCYLP